jgi:hypothetical protein
MCDSANASVSATLLESTMTMLPNIWAGEATVGPNRSAAFSVSV